MSEVSEVKLPSQAHCCMSEAKMAAPLNLAVLLMKLILTSCQTCVCVCGEGHIRNACSKENKRLSVF